MTTTVAALTSEIPGVTSAVDAVRAKLREFEGTGQRIRAAQHRAAVLAGIATQQGRTTESAQLRAQITRLGTLAAKADETRERVAPVLNWLKANGFGAVFIPVLIATAAVSAATAIAYVIAQTSVEERQLDALASGLLTPEQLIQLRQQGGGRGLFNVDLGPVVPYLMIGAALYLFGPQILRALAGGRGRAA